MRLEELVFSGLEGLVQYRFVSPERTVLGSPLVPTPGLERIPQEVLYTCNVYVGAALRDEHGIPKVWPALWADLDGVRDDWEPPPGLPKPNIVVRTSEHGLHLWWLLERPLTDPEQVRSLLRGTSKALSPYADLRAAEPSRLLRLPGTFNWNKDGYRVQVQVLSTARHSPQAFPREEVRAVEVPEGYVHPVPFRLEDTRIPPELQAAARRGWRAGDPWPSPSELDFAVMCAMLEAEHTPEEVLGLFLTYDPEVRITHPRRPWKDWERKIRYSLQKATAQVAQSRLERLLLLPPRSGPYAEYRHYTQIREDPLPPPDWLVEGVVQLDEVTMVCGPSFSGKSEVALDLCVSVAAGVPFLGRFPVKYPTHVAYVFGEQAPSAWEHRLLHRAAVRGVSDRTLPITLVNGYRRNVNDPQDLSWFVDRFLEWGTGLAIFDSLTSLVRIPGEKGENQANVVAQAVRSPLYQLMVESGCSVVVVHHSGKDYLSNEPASSLELVRGSTDLIAMTGAVVGVWKHPHSGDVKVMVTSRAGGVLSPARFSAPPELRDMGEWTSQLVNFRGRRGHGQAAVQTPDGSPGEAEEDAQGRH